ncbi:MAG: penicillin acylase family protein [Salaquimonas sp.]
MKRAFKYLGWSLLGAGMIASALMLGGFGLLKQTVAPYNGKAQLAGLSSNVAVVRDRHGIPHIEAENRLDVVRALGWVHASERIWQMEVLRMAGQGRLSEMFGEKTVSSDRFLRTINIPDSAQKSVTVLRADTVELLQAYADGVNSWINRKTDSFEPSLPVEFIVLGHHPERWEIWHSLTVLKVMALTLDANMEEEIGRLALAAKGFNPREIDEIYLVGPRDNPPLLPDLRVLYGFDKIGKTSSNTARSSHIQLATAHNDEVPLATAHNHEVPLATAPWQLQLPASNNWAISGSRTESGMPLLANDPHLGLTAPSVFYLAHLRWQKDGETQNLIGGSLPGTPLILSGRNDHLAWGLTTTYLDSQDLFLEQINPENIDQYRTIDGFKSFISEEITIKVKGGDDVSFIRRTTDHGPVLPDGYEKLKERLPDGHVAALSWTALATDDTTFDGAFDISIAQNVSEFMARTRRMVSPMQSIVVADMDGKIGLIAPGRIPKRSEYNKIQGRAPVPGWVPFYNWYGHLGPFEAPTIVNPVSGAVATANANWLPAKYNNHITFDWPEHFRQDRVEDLFIRTNQKHSMETMIAGQSDSLSRALMKFRDTALAQIPQGVMLNEGVLEALQNWDGMMDADSSVPLILNAWHRNLQDLMLKDDLEDDFELVEKGNITRMLEMLRSTGARDWCNKINTPERESCGEILFEAIEMALVELGGTYGSDWTKWRWGTAHITLHEHRPFTQVGALSPYFTIRAEMDGGKYTLLRNSNDFEKDEPYAGMHGSALRTIYDFSDLEKSIFIISTGQSGNGFSSHYDDLSKKWAKLEYVPMVTNPENYRPQAAGTFILEASAQ